MNLYLDASFFVALHGDEVHTPVAIKLVTETTDTIIVSDLARGEISSAISRKVRSGEFDDATGRLHLGAIDEWIATAAEPIATEAADIRLAIEIVRNFSFGLRFPDAVHVAATYARSLRLATFDKRMRAAAESLKIEVATA